MLCNTQQYMNMYDITTHYTAMMTNTHLLMRSRADKNIFVSHVNTFYRKNHVA